MVQAKSDTGSNPFSNILVEKKIAGQDCAYFDLNALKDPRYAALPFSIRVLLESGIRNCDGFHVTKDDVEALLGWSKTQSESREFPFRPARVLLQDFTGVPAVVDLAAMREAVVGLGGSPDAVNPLCPVDLVIDHSVQVDHYGDLAALEKNQAMEFERNRERFLFLKWGAKAFRNMLIVPPGSGIVHQVNLEYLARVVFRVEAEGGLLYPDSVVGTDSHTTMICGSGVVGWGVGGIEAEAVMLGQAISMVIPEVVGFRMTGTLPQVATSTDLVLTVVKRLREIGVVGKFVEFFGPAVESLSIADRATIANMCPEYGATVGYFPVDTRTLEYLRQTGRGEAKVQMIEEYLKAVGMFRNYSDASQDPEFTRVVDLNLDTIVPSLSGPKRPHDQVAVTDIKEDFRKGLTAKLGFKGFGLDESALSRGGTVEMDGEKVEIRHGTVCIAAITSCTNTSNPSVMLGAGLLAKAAVERGLKVSPVCKTSLSPGSGVVTKYLTQSGLLPFLEQLGFFIAGYGCMTCIGNSGPLPDPVAKIVDEQELVVAGVLSGNRNFEGRIHAQVKANYLAGPPLVVAFALAGRVDIDFATEPLGLDKDGKPVFLSEIWPSRDTIAQFEQSAVLPQFFTECYNSIGTGSAEWQSLSCPDSQLYPWDPASTYIKRVPFFDGMGKEAPGGVGVTDAFALLNLGDSVTTDHISPAGAISKSSPAARYLLSKGMSVKEFNTYGARRGNDEVMGRGTFANIRLLNKFMGRQMPKTLHVPSGETMDVWDAAERYRSEGSPVVILAGKEYGSGSSRDWAAKGPYLQGVRAVLAESFERIHRSNLVGMGIVPLEYLPGQSADSHALSGKEQFSLQLPAHLKPRQELQLTTSTGVSVPVVVRFDTEVELEYYRHGGILQYMIRKLASA